MSGNGGLNSINVTIKPKNYQVNQNTNLKKLNNIDLSVAQNEYTINENFFNNYSDLEVPTLEELKEATKNYGDAISTAQQKQILKADEAINNYLDEHPLAKDIANLTQAASYNFFKGVDFILDNMMRSQSMQRQGELIVSGQESLANNIKDITNKAIEKDWVSGLYDENVVIDGHKSVANIANRIDNFLDEHPLAKDISNITQAASYGVLNTYGKITDIVAESIGVEGYNNYIDTLYDENVVINGHKSVTNVANRIDNYLDEHPLAKDISNITQAASYGNLNKYGKITDIVADSIGVEGYDNYIDTLYDENVLPNGTQGIKNMANRIANGIGDVVQGAVSELKDTLSE